MRFRVRLLDLKDRAAARRELERTGADEAGVAKMVDKARFVAIQANGVHPAGANILKQEALSIGAEVAVARGVITCQVDSTNVIITGTRKQMLTLMRKLKPQPFGLRTLAAEMKAAMNAEKAELELIWSGGVLELSKKVHVMGVLNVTPDSFSDGGDFADRDAALAQAMRMVDEGADILDIGGESSRPGADAVGEAEELGRVLPVIEYLAPRVGVPLSVDTYKASVARRAVEAGAAIVNDISGLRLDPDMAATVADTGAALVVMHMRGTPRDMQTDTGYTDIVGEIFELLLQSVENAVAAGVARERVIIDPGVGFGKSVEGNLTLLNRLAEFASMGQPLLVGASRKSFIGTTLGIDEPKERLEGSLAAAVLAVEAGAQIIRAHDVEATRRAVDLAWAVKTAKEG